MTIDYKARREIEGRLYNWTSWTQHWAKDKGGQLLPAGWAAAVEAIKQDIVRQRESLRTSEQLLTDATAAYEAICAEAADEIWDEAKESAENQGLSVGMLVAVAGHETENMKNENVKTQVAMLERKAPPGH